ncbi:hypothetical protein BX265_8560 [Streptomyces sp. TLI_235]|nr:hypothetical protein BX265_8560 [Streptomyces sp. TLI_235]
MSATPAILGGGPTARHEYAYSPFRRGPAPGPAVEKPTRTVQVARRHPAGVVGQDGR